MNNTKRITANELSLLAHYYYMPEDHTLFLDKRPAWVVAEKRLVGAGLIQKVIMGPGPDDDERVWKLTDKGIVYVEALLCIPFPEATWAVKF